MKGAVEGALDKLDTASSEVLGLEEGTPEALGVVLAKVAVVSACPAFFGRRYRCARQSMHVREIIMTCVARRRATGGGTQRMRRGGIHRPLPTRCSTAVS